eukprot:1439521-Pleurochrysis_carterae.AAC.1
MQETEEEEEDEMAANAAERVESPPVNPISSSTRTAAQVEEETRAYQRQAREEAVARDGRKAIYQR